MRNRNYNRDQDNRDQYRNDQYDRQASRQYGSQRSQYGSSSNYNDEGMREDRSRDSLHGAYGYEQPRRSSQYGSSGISEDRYSRGSSDYSNRDRSARFNEEDDNLYGRRRDNDNYDEEDMPETRYSSRRSDWEDDQDDEQMNRSSRNWDRDRDNNRRSQNLRSRNY